MGGWSLELYLTACFVFGGLDGCRQASSEKANHSVELAPLDFHWLSRIARIH